jgi:xanthine dehydrogenase large subunit
LAARATGRPCKLRLDRDADMAMTGKRHDFLVEYAVGYEANGRIRAVDLDLAARCGCSADLSLGVVDRAMFHADNAYFLPQFKINSRRVKTNTVSNTAFRGFGGPQGMLAIERVIDTIAWNLRFDPLDVRRANLYSAGRDVTPYGQTVEDHDVALRLIEQLERSSSYRLRRNEIKEFNTRSPILKRGIALTPVKFGISFTLTHLNQAGALVHVYQDGSVHLNHGGTEMGQGLFQKVAQVAAEELGIGLERVHITATSTDKVPNTSATAASSGTDLNGMAVQSAVREIKSRLTRLFRSK